MFSACFRFIRLYKCQLTQMGEQQARHISVLVCFLLNMNNYKSTFQLMTSVTPYKSHI